MQFISHQCTATSFRKYCTNGVLWRDKLRHGCNILCPFVLSGKYYPTLTANIAIRRLVFVIKARRSHTVDYTITHNASTWRICNSDAKLVISTRQWHSTPEINCCDQNQSFDGKTIGEKIWVHVEIWWFDVIWSCIIKRFQIFSWTREIQEMWKLEGGHVPPAPGSNVTACTTTAVRYRRLQVPRDVRTF